MCTIDQLKERIDNNIHKVNDNENLNREEHKTLSKKVDEVLSAVESLRLVVVGKTEKYDDRYVLRRDFKIVSAVVGTAISILAFFGFTK